MFPYTSIKRQIIRKTWNLYVARYYIYWSSHHITYSMKAECKRLYSSTLRTNITDKWSVHITSYSYRIFLAMFIIEFIDRANMTGYPIISIIMNYCSRPIMAICFQFYLNYILWIAYRLVDTRLINLFIHIWKKYKCTKKKLCFFIIKQNKL